LTTPVKGIKIVPAFVDVKEIDPAKPEFKPLSLRYKVVALTVPLVGA
jgi:hypothetical protein